jgi:hypothetical protein
VWHQSAFVIQEPLAHKELQEYQTADLSLVVVLEALVVLLCHVVPTKLV